MTGANFLSLALELVRGLTEAEWRSAVSRAYYGAFHVARELLLACGFKAPRGDQAHAYLWLRLSNAHESDVEDAGRDLQSLRGDRNRADYELTRPLNQATALAQVQAAQQIVQVLEAAKQLPTRMHITDAMKAYERDILRTVTWRP